MEKENEIIFADEKHREFFEEQITKVRCQDCYHIALVYTLGISEDTRRNFSRIYDIKTGLINPDCIHDGWITSGSARIVRLAFNLYNDGEPTAFNIEDPEEKYNECSRYSVSYIFSYGNFPYFMQAIKLRYPEYS